MTDSRRTETSGPLNEYIAAIVGSPSAAGHGTVLAIFSDRLRAGSHVTDLDYKTWEAPPG